MNTLITGVTGLLGLALTRENKGRNKIKGIYLGNYRMPDDEFIKYVVCDVADKNKLFESCANESIECIIHTAGLADTDMCEKMPELAYVSNVEGTNNIIELACCKGAKLVYISSNAVFDGENPPYREESNPRPINKYGKIKLECEYLVRKNIEKYLIVRPILMYGLNNLYERKSFFYWVLEKLKRRENINVVNDVLENPLLSYQCAEAIWALIDKDVSGTYHIAGKNILSRYESANVIADVFSQDAGLLNPVSSDFFADIVPRPRNTAYLTGKIEKETGFKPLAFREGLEYIKILKQKGRDNGAGF